MHIIHVPIEPLEERYSKQWLTMFQEYADNDTKNTHHFILGTTLTETIENGAFLDVCGTNYYKSSQLQKIMEMLHTGIPTDTTFLFYDAWFPGVEMLAYVRDALNLKFKITGCLHAGTYDQSDFTALVGMHRWGKDLENSWFKIYDKLFVATSYHKELICSNRSILEDKIIITGFPLFLHEIFNKEHEKSKLVVFPHRLTPDKNPQLFELLTVRIKTHYPDWRFIKSQDKRRTKEEYYNLLSEAYIAVSFADHENWGIAMQEATLCGCIPFVPNRLSYKEMYTHCFLYDQFADLVGLMFQALYAYGKRSVCVDELLVQRGIFRKSAIQAIPNIMKEITHARII